MFGRVPNMWVTLLTRSQPLSTYASQFPVAQATGDDPRHSPRVPLSEQRLYPEDICRAARAGCLCATASALRGGCSFESRWPLPQVHRCRSRRRAKTVRRWLRAGGAPRWLKPRRAGALGPYYDHLDRHWRRELVALGFAGHPGSVRQWAKRRRKSEPDTVSTSGTQTVDAQPASARQIARLVMTDEALPEAEQDPLSRMLAQLPGLADCIAAAKRLNALLRRKSTETLEKVLTDAADTALKKFVAGLQRDLSAVQAALDLPWTISPAVGQINRLKILKRTMFGRAGFALRCARVLHAS